MQNVEIDQDQATVKINPKVYPIEAVYSAAYVFMDRAYIMLDGDPDTEILVRIKLKSEGSLKDIGDEFNNELLSFAEYLSRARETKKLREMFLQRAIITNDPGMSEPSGENQSEQSDVVLEDPEGIAIPWEEKYGKNEDKTEQ